jgi:hypothetical protein
VVVPSDFMTKIFCALYDLPPHSPLFDLNHEVSQESIKSFEVPHAAVPRTVQEYPPLVRNVICDFVLNPVTQKLSFTQQKKNCSKFCVYLIKDLNSVPSVLVELLLSNTTTPSSETVVKFRFSNHNILNTIHKNGVKSFRFLWKHDAEEQDIPLHCYGNFQSSIILSLFKILCVE